MGGDAGSGDASTVGTWVSISMGKDAQKGHEKQCRHVRVEAQSVSRCESRPRERARGWPSGVEVEGGSGANGLVLWSEGTLEAVRVLFRKQCLSLCVIESFLVTETERDQTAHTSQSTRHTEHARRHPRRHSKSCPQHSATRPFRCNSMSVFPSAMRFLARSSTCMCGFSGGIVASHTRKVALFTTLFLRNWAHEPWRSFMRSRMGSQAIVSLLLFCVQMLSVNSQMASVACPDADTTFQRSSSLTRGPMPRSEARTTRSCQRAARHPELTLLSRATSSGCKCTAISSMSSIGRVPHGVSKPMSGLMLSLATAWL